jgi:hypothetical protein
MTIRVTFNKKYKYLKKKSFKKKKRKKKWVAAVWAATPKSS